MNPKIYSIQKDGKSITVKTLECPLGVVRRLFGIKKYVPWERVSEKITIINNEFTVEEIDIPLNWVKWA